MSPDGAESVGGQSALTLSPTGAPSRPAALRSPDGRFRRSTSAIERYEINQQLNQSRLRAPAGSPGRSAGAAARGWQGHTGADAGSSPASHLSQAQSAAGGAPTIVGAVAVAPAQGLATGISEAAFTGARSITGMVHSAHPPRVTTSMLYSEAQSYMLGAVTPLNEDHYSITSSINGSTSTLGTPVHRVLTPALSVITGSPHPCHRARRTRSSSNGGTSGSSSRGLGIRVDAGSDGGEFSSGSTLKSSTPRTPHGTRLSSEVDQDAPTSAAAALRSDAAADASGAIEGVVNSVILVPTVAPYVNTGGGATGSCEPRAPRDPE